MSEKEGIQEHKIKKRRNINIFVRKGRGFQQF